MKSRRYLVLLRRSLKAGVILASATVAIFLLETFVIAFNNQTGLYTAILASVGSEARDTYARFIFLEDRTGYPARARKKALLRVVSADVLGERRMRFDLTALFPVLNKHNPDNDEPLRPHAGVLVFCSGNAAILKQAVEHYRDDIDTLNSLRGRAIVAVDSCREQYLQVEPDLRTLDKELRARLGGAYRY
jgi:hypothetical protein